MEEKKTTEGICPHILTLRLISGSGHEKYSKQKRCMHEPLISQVLWI